VFELFRASAVALILSNTYAALVHSDYTLAEDGLLSAEAMGCATLLAFFVSYLA
jgi:hypothetical protein